MGQSLSFFRFFQLLTYADIPTRIREGLHAAPNFAFTRFGGGDCDARIHEFEGSPEEFEYCVTKSAQHLAPHLVARGTLTFDERVEIHRGGEAHSKPQGIG